MPPSRLGSRLWDHALFLAQNPEVLAAEVEAGATGNRERKTTGLENTIVVPF